MPVPPKPIAPRPAPRPAAPPKPSAGKPRELREFRPAPDPLAKVKATGDVAADAAAEFDAIDEGFRQRMANEQSRVNDELDSENWFAVVFETRAQKDEFLERLGLLDHGDKYLDGVEVAKILKIDLSPSGRKYRPAPKIDPKFSELAKPVSYRK